MKWNQLIAMLTLLLVGVLLAQVLGAPNLCDGPCDSGNGYQSRSSYSRYSKSSTGQNYAGRPTVSSGLGVTGGRLEDLDTENVVNSFGNSKGVSYEDKKHFVTDDRRGEAHYKEGQEVFDNGYKKWSESKWEWDSQGNYQPRADSHILSAAEFNGKIRELNQRIATFMGSYHGSQTITAQTLDDFNANANLITGQLNDVCNQVGQDTALYQQAQNLLQSFQRQQAQKQQELTASYQATFHHESSSSSKFRVGSSSPITPSASIYRPAPIVAVTQRPVVDQQFIIQQQQTVEKYNECQNLIQNFFNEFRVPNTDQQYREDLNNQINLINQNLVELSHSSVQNDSTRIAIQTMKDQFERYVSDLQAKIRQIEQKQREEAEEIRRRIQQYETQKRQNDEELQRLQDAENQEKRRQQELRQQIDRAQQISLQDQIKIEEERRRLETQNQQLQQLQQPLTAPRLATLSISSTYESSVQASGSAGSSTQNTLTPVVNQPIIQPTVQHRPAPAPIQILQPHVDVTALVSKYNREVHRLQNELVNFQMQVARLTEENSATLLPTVNNQVENFRREIDDLCGNSQRYQLDDVHQRALDVKSRFDSVLQNFQNVKSSFTASSGYSSGSSWSSSGRYSHQVPAKIVGGDSTNSQVLEVEHVKRPASGHSGYSASAGYSSSSEYNSSGSFRSGGADDCPERAAGQPCASSLRYKRHAGADSGAYYDNSDRPLDFQQHQSVFGGSPYRRQPNVGPLVPQLQQYMQQNPGPQIGILHLDPYRGILKPPSAGLRDYSQRTRPVESQRHSSGPIRSQSQTMSQGHRPEDLTRQSDEMEDYYGTRSQINRPISGEGLESRQMPEDLSQQHQTFENDREFESYQKPRSESVGVSYRPRDKVQPTRITNLGNESNSRGIRRQIEFSTENPESVNDPSRIKPMTSEGEEPIMLERIQQGNRSKSDKESDGQTLQNSGFYDGFQRNAKAEEIEEPETGFSIVSAADLLGENPDELQSTKQSEQTLQNSGFYQKPRQNEFTINSDFNNKNENVSAAASDNHYDAQGLVPENLTKFEVLGNQDSTQRTAGQRNLNSGSQENGQYSSLSNSKPDKTGYGNDSDNPTIKLAVRPIPRYTAPWQVSHEVSQDSRIGKDQIVDLNSSIGQTFAPQNPSQSDSNDHSGPLRGDLPGISHPKDDVDTPTSLPPVSIATAQTPLPPAVKIITTTTSLPYVIQIPTTARPMKIIDCNICGQRHEQIVDQSNSFHNSRWVHNISQQNQFNQGQYAEQYHYNETSRTHHDYHVTHSTNYFNQQNSRLELRQQVPFSRQNSQIQFSQTLQPVGINVEQSSSNQYRQHYTNNFETQRLKPQEFQQRNQFGLDQQVQEPVFDQQSGQNRYGQQHEDSLIDNQRTESNFQKVIPLHEKSLPTESATSHQFWKRVGHKLSYSFDKAREGARTIFG